MAPKTTQIVVIDADPKTPDKVRANLAKTEAKFELHCFARPDQAYGALNKRNIDILLITYSQARSFDWSLFRPGPENLWLSNVVIILEASDLSIIYQALTNVAHDCIMRDELTQDDLHRVIQCGVHRAQKSHNEFMAVQKLLTIERQFLEISELKEQLKVSYDQLIELNSLKDRFLGMAAHDLRNPLGVISGYVDVLLQDILGPVNNHQRDVFGKIKRASTHMLKLINDLLDISVIESGNLKLNKEPVPLFGLLSDVVEAHTLLAKGKDIGIKAAFDKTLPVITVDPIRITQVLDNLISNAIKYSHTKTVITVQASTSRTQIAISVIDQGQGIPQDELHKLFAPFSQTSVRATAGEQSTGLGLAIVKKIVEAHGGDIAVKSEVGRGSAFTVHLPVG